MRRHGIGAAQVSAIDQRYERHAADHPGHQVSFQAWQQQARMQQAVLDPDAEDLPCITWVGDGHTRPPWIEKSFPNTRRIYRTTTGTVMLAMARAGLGIARLACVFIR